MNKTKKYPVSLLTKHFLPLAFSFFSSADSEGYHSAEILGVLEALGSLEALRALGALEALGVRWKFFNYSLLTTH